jgi:hypothetical protein
MHPAVGHRPDAYAPRSGGIGAWELRLWCKQCGCVACGVLWRGHTGMVSIVSSPVGVASMEIVQTLFPLRKTM